MNKLLFIIKHAVAKEVAMIEIDKFCQERGITDFDVMTEEEFGTTDFVKENHVFAMPPVPKEPIYETAHLEQERREERFRKEQNKLRARFYKRGRYGKK